MTIALNNSGCIDCALWPAQVEVLEMFLMSNLVKVLEGIEPPRHTPQLEHIHCNHQQCRSRSGDDHQEEKRSICHW